MNKKYIKMLVAILVLIIGVSISINVNAGYELFKNDAMTFKEYDGDIAKKYFKGTKTRIGQHISGTEGNEQTALLFCVQAMQNYKATLTKETLGNREAGAETTHVKGSRGEAPFEAGTTMSYERKDSVTDQAFAYLIATAQERGILNKMYTQYAVWALDINIGRKEEPNALATEAINYKQFYNAIHDKNGKSTYQITNKTNTNNIKVGIDTTNKNEYTIGKFKFSYPTGEPNKEVSKGEDNDVSNEDEETREAELKTLEDMLKNSNKVYNHIKDNRTVSEGKITYNSNIIFKEKIGNYYNIHEDIQNNYTNHKNDKNYTISDIMNDQKRLQEAAEQLTAKKSAATLNSEISSIENKITTLNNEITTLNSDINRLNSDIKALNREINKLDKNKDKEKIKALQAQIEEKNKEIENKNKEIENKNKELENQNKNLENKKKQKEAVDARDNIKKFQLEPEEAKSEDTDMLNAATQFSYVTGVTVVGCDENGNEIEGKEIASNKIVNGKMQKGMTILDKNGDEIKHDITYKDGTKIKDANLPISGESFYVRFEMENKNNDNKIKRIKVKVTTEYLESCTGTFHYYEGTWYKWYWSAATETQPYKEDKCDPATCTLAAPHDGHIIKSYYREYWVLKRDAAGNPQKFIGIDFDEGGYESGKVVAKKNWATAEAELTNENPPIITMELGGYAWIDKDEGKVNAGDNLLKNKGEEVLPGAEVWLYEYNGSNKDGEPKDSKLWGIQLTDDNGHYLFTGLNAEKKYYVKFVYNGMMYTGVEYNVGNPAYNSADWEKTSKANEVGRQEFNQKFAEIGSYPANYMIGNKVFGDELGNYNIVYQQEDIVEIYKEISAEIVKNGGNLKEACEEIARKYGSTEDAKRKIQFAVDCRMKAQTDTKQKRFNGADETYVYPVYKKFTTTKEANLNQTQPETVTIAGETYNLIYPGQRYINYGMKARTTFDMALYKDVYKAEMSINGKTETYNYDQTVTAKIGVSESDYLNGLRGMYQSNASYTNTEKTGNIDTGEYTLDTRREEVANGQSSNYNLGNNGKVEDYQLNNDYTNLNPKDEKYKGERLKIFVTYKIAVVNQSATVGAITEIADYFDTNYEFVDAYIGNENGTIIENGHVTKYDNSMYSNTEYKSTKNSYKTIYLRPDVETRLDNGETQYMYVVLQLLGPSNDAGTLLSSKLLNNETLEVINLAEINGYKTYNSKTDNSTPGLVDIDSNPGNLNISDIDALTKENIINYPNIRSMYEDDTNRAPVLVYKTSESRTIEGTVFEDNTGWNDATIHTKDTRKGNGQLGDDDKGIKGVVVELVEIKDNEMIVRSTTTTNSDGWYGFIGFLPGNYTVRYTYGSNDDTAMNKTSQYILGLNDKSYNGQDYQSTIFTEKGNAKSTEKYQGENILKYNNGESPVYWYTDTDNPNNPRYSDAQDDANRVKEVIYYSKEEYDDKEIINHKAEVFNAYNPQPSHINEQQNRALADELERRTYRYAYTPEMEVEIEYATRETKGNIAQKHKIEGVDFGIVERPRSELVIDQDISRIKVVAADGVTVLFDSDGTGTTSNLQWVKGKEIQNLSNGQYLYRGGEIGQQPGLDGYDKNELVNIIMDEELISGAKLEVTYKFTVTNNSERDTKVTDNDVTTRAKTIVNYVSNNLTFDADQNTGWTVVNKSEIQKEDNSTYINKNLVDLNTQAVILKTTTDENVGLTKALKPGEQTTAELVLTKVLSAESTLDDLTYTNLAEIVEIDNTVGRYDHGATPGNQSLERNPAEHDAAGASKYDNGMGNPGTPGNPGDPGNPPDGVIIITPPTGSTYIYYVIGITSAVILAVGVYLIKKFIIDRK